MPDETRPSVPNRQPTHDQQPADEQAYRKGEVAEEPSESKPDVTNRPPETWVRLSGAGMELALITIAFGAAGALADHQLDLQRPITSATGGLVGFTLGMIRFIRLATTISGNERAADQQATERKKRHSTDQSNQR